MAESASAELAGLGLEDGKAASHHPPTIIVIGMAGSGKTQLVRRLQSHLTSRDLRNYVINLDPAAVNVPYEPNIDIQDTVNYKNVMKEYSLGPNGAIMTSLNLFATRFDQVLALLGKDRTREGLEEEEEEGEEGEGRASAPGAGGHARPEAAPETASSGPLKYAVLDTPGQIEIFTWSASGAIITEAAAAAAPTCLVFVVDTPRASAPAAFMSNMLQACSIAYRTRLPLVLAFNKSDVVAPDFALSWMQDYEVFQSALEADATYAATLSRSLSLVLERFYEGLAAVGVSALTGEGFDDLLDACDRAFDEYAQTYLVDLRKRQRKRDALERRRQRANMEEFEQDRGANGDGSGARVPPEPALGPPGRPGGLGAVPEGIEEGE